MEALKVLEAGLKAGASDIHLSAGQPPLARVDGALVELLGFRAMTAEQCKSLLYSLLTEERRAQGNGPNRREGVGLGLSIARELVTRHHGELWVESAPGKGSTFSFSLPTAP